MKKKMATILLQYHQHCGTHSKIADNFFAVDKQKYSSHKIPAMLKRIYKAEFTKQQMKLSSIIDKTLGEISCDGNSF